MAGVQDATTDAAEIVPTVSPEVALASESPRHSFFVRISSLTFSWTALLLSAGVPYWFYLQNRHRFASENENANNAENGNEDRERALPEENGQGIAHHLTRVWNAHQIMVAIMLAPLFPLISVSPLPKCSWAYVFASLSLLCGLKTYAICIFYKEHFEAPVASVRLSEVWKEHESKRFFDEATLRLWVLLSLPTVWFSSFIMNYSISVFMLVVEVESAYVDSSIIVICDAEHTHFRRASIAIFTIAVIASFVFMKCAEKSLSHS